MICSGYHHLTLVKQTKQRNSGTCVCAFAKTIFKTLRYGNTTMYFSFACPAFSPNVYFCVWVFLAFSFSKRGLGILSLNSWTNEIKLFTRNEHLFQHGMWIYKRFSDNESFKIDETPLASNFHQFNQCAISAKRFCLSLDLSISLSLSVYFYVVHEWVWVLWSIQTVIAIQHKWTKSNRNYNGSSDYRLCSANGKRRGIKFKQFALFLNATISFIYHWRFFLCAQASPALNSFHFRNDLVAVTCEMF